MIALGPGGSLEIHTALALGEPQDQLGLAHSPMAVDDDVLGPRRAPALLQRLKLVYTVVKVHDIMLAITLKLRPCFHVRGSMGGRVAAAQPSLCSDRAVGERGTSRWSGAVPITLSPTIEVTPNQ